MSAPRRTPTKQQTGSTATVASRPSTPAASAPPRPARPTGDKGKAVQQSQPSVVAVRIEAVRRLLRDTWSEMNKINWPDRETTRNLTIVVIGISVVLGLLLGGIDYILVQLLGVF
jgi:preprotein translocase subunit SecE